MNTPTLVPLKKGTEIDKIYNDLEKIATDSIRTIPEGLFYWNFLPLFSGDPVPPQVNMATWIAIAGNPFNPVNVIDAQGNFIYQVPPVFEMEGIKPSDRKHFSLQGMLQQMSNLNTSFPARAKQYFDQHMAVLDLQNDPKQFAQKYVEQWNLIFLRYGKTLLTTVESLEKKVAQIEANRLQLSYGEDDLL